MSPRSCAGTTAEPGTERAPIAGQPGESVVSTFAAKRIRISESLPVTAWSQLISAGSSACGVDVGVGDGLAVGVGLGDGEALGVGDSVGVGDGDGVGDGVDVAVEQEVPM